MPKEKRLFRGDTNLFIACGLRFRAQPAMLVKPASMMQGIFEAERMINGARKLNHFLVES